MTTLRVSLKVVDGVWTADVPEGVSGWTIIEEHGDGTVTVEVDDAYALQLRLNEAERPDHVQTWTAPTGAHDAPNIGDHRWHEGQVWRSLIVGNTTVPGSDDRWWDTTVPPVIPDSLRDPLKALRPSVGADTQALIDVLVGDS